MPSLLQSALCGVFALLFFAGVGFPLARSLTRERVLTWAMAPALGWAVFCPAALPILRLVGFAGWTVVLLAGAALPASLAATALIKFPEPADDDRLNVPWGAYPAAALLALGPVLALLPKRIGEGVFLSDPMFDHSKIAIIDNIARLGLPPGNPFFGALEPSAHLAYYYLWHFGAAMFVPLFGASGWEADIGLTWFTTFASLSLVMGLAVWFGGRRSAATWVVLLGIAGSLQPILALIFGEQGLGLILSPHIVLQSWIVQATWAPQHLASATCVVIAAFLMSRLGNEREPRIALVLVLGLVCAAGFESSTWIGGITFAIAAIPLVLARIWLIPREHRLAFVARIAGAAAIALGVSLPLLRDQYLAGVARAAGLPIALRPQEVLGSLFALPVRRVLDLPAFWLLLLTIQLPAIYIAGAIVVGRSVTKRKIAPQDRHLAIILAVLTVACFTVSWLLASVVANNDLGWRAVLPGIMVLTLFAAVGLARWLAKPSAVAALTALLLFALGLPDGIGFLAGNLRGEPAESEASFAWMPQAWAAVRLHTGPRERVANNPLAFWTMTAWPVNISWALLADRDSCFAGWALGSAFMPLPQTQLDKIDALFTRVFAGTGSGEDVHLMATRYGCDTILVIAQDGAWTADPFAVSPDYHLVEQESGRWRIYRVNEGR